MNFLSMGKYYIAEEDAKCVYLMRKEGRLIVATISNEILNDVGFEQAQNLLEDFVRLFTKAEIPHGNFPARVTEAWANSIHPTDDYDGYPA